MNLDDYYRTHYLPRLLAKGVAAATIQDYEALVRVAPADPDAESITLWLSGLASSPATRNRYRRYMLAILRDARRHGLVDGWIEDIPRAIESERLPRAWRVEEFSRLLEACRSLGESYAGVPAAPWWRSFLLVLWYTGLRVQSLLGARLDDCDLDSATLAVVSSKDRRELIYALPDDACQAIRVIWRERTHVWPWPFIDAKKTLLRRIRHLICEAELPQLRNPFHAIRRSVASYVTLEAGVSCACDFLDHCRCDITRRYYVDPRITNTVRRGGQWMPQPH